MKLKQSELLLGTYWTGWYRWFGWSICLGILPLLGTLRAATDAEFAFATIALLPVLVISWFEGRYLGLLIAFLASAMWATGDLASDRQFGALWVPLANAVTRFITYALIVLLAAQVHRQIVREHEDAARDPLTGLQNRRAFLRDGATEIERATRYEHPLAIVFLDLDDFKQLNDTRGHDAGDAALKATGVALLGAMRASDRVARLGGDEFVALLPEIEYNAAIDAGHKLADRIKKVLRDFQPVGVSIGVAWFGKADRSFPEMLKVADELMYQAKENGKGTLLSRRVSDPPAPESESHGMHA